MWVTNTEHFVQVLPSGLPGLLYTEKIQVDIPPPLLYLSYTAYSWWKKDQMTITQSITFDV